MRGGRVQQGWGLLLKPALLCPARHVRSPLAHPCPLLGLQAVQPNSCYPFLTLLGSTAHPHTHTPSRGIGVPTAHPTSCKLPQPIHACDLNPATLYESGPDAVILMCPPPRVTAPCSLCCILACLSPPDSHVPSSHSLAPPDATVDADLTCGRQAGRQPFGWQAGREGGRGQQRLARGRS